MKAIIIASGTSVSLDIFEEFYEKSSYLICADGGLNYIDKLNIVPNLIVGDFDSVDVTLLEKYKNIKMCKFQPEKDFTDTEIAVEAAVKAGYNEIVILGATGTRLDHTMANILLIERYLKNNINITIADNNNHIQALNKNIVIDKKLGYYLSIIPITDYIGGITLIGLKYPLDNVKVERGSTLCVSNKIVDSKAYIEIKEGVGLLFLSRD